MRSWVRMRSESTVALGQPRETNPTFGVAVDIGANLIGRSVGAADQKVRNSSGAYEAWPVLRVPPATFI
ncbi:hypothetical protein D3C84_1181910 [compost metagenome]